jgi:hypothetical protein
MKRTVVAVALISLLFASAAQAQAPKPDPELKKLQVLVGHWTYDGEYKAGPLGPGSKITGEYTGRMVLKGFFLQGEIIEKGAMGETRSLEINAYDPVNKNFISNTYSDDGSRFWGTVTVNGNTLTWEGKYVVAGKQFQFREPFILAPDLMSATAKGEISVDGKTWIPFFESKYIKLKSTPKK